MKKTLSLLFLLALGSSSLAIGNVNLSDDMDVNEVPAPLEERKNEGLNTSDSIDQNSVPASDELRQEEEEIDVRGVEERLEHGDQQENYNSDLLDDDHVDEHID